MTQFSDLFSGQSEMIAAMARQYGVSVEQTQTAVNAMMPTFAAGIQQQMQSADSIVGLLSMLAQNQQAAFLDASSLGKGGAGVDAGRAFLDQLMSSGTGAVNPAAQSDMIRQAAGLSGIGMSILQKMLPMIATMVVSSLLKGFSKNGLDGLLGSILGGGGSGGAKRGGASDNPLGDLLGDLLGRTLGGGGTREPEPEAKPQPRRKSQPEPEVEAAPSNNPLGDILRDMFQQGGELQKTQREGLESIFDQILRQNRR